jgi:cyclopropane fatty-acyl-phospholipid synthase-like methyltransferase
MTIATGGKMLNFGYWDDSVQTPLDAQRLLCTIVGELAELKSARCVIDVGSGLGAPAAYWMSSLNSLQVACVNINFLQLKGSKEDVSASLVNSTSTALPFATGCVDRVIALESAQHFRPLERFVQESARVLEEDGLLVMAIPVLKSFNKKKKLSHYLSLGILSMTWSSEHYALEYVESAIKGAGLSIESLRYIGPRVYEPLADYYLANRTELKPKILEVYPVYLEKVLFRSILKMKLLSQRGFIEYVLIKARKPESITKKEVRSVPTLQTP